MPKTYYLKSQPSIEPLNSFATFQIALCNSLRSDEEDEWLLFFSFARVFWVFSMISSFLAFGFGGF